MNLDLVDKIVNAVLYEGYMLYPYRPTSVKNQQRWNFGVLYPPAYGARHNGNEATSMQTECLVLCEDVSVLEVRVRFLHLLQRQVQKISESGADAQAVEALEVDGQLYQSWQEAVEREVLVPTARIRDLASSPRQLHFSFPAMDQSEQLREKSGQIMGLLVRRQELVCGAITLAASRVAEGVTKLTVRVSNQTAFEDLGADAEKSDRDQALLRSAVSTHTILGIHQGEFISQLDPPQHLSHAGASCNNLGTWPVLVGAEGTADTMLSSPIILYDYPQIAPESVGNLFDGTEIDEILTLRIMTLTEEEKREMRGVDDRARQILERTETLPVEQLMKMHGAVRGLKRVTEKG
jgi:hypothetical protein